MARHERALTTIEELLNVYKTVKPWCSSCVISEQRVGGTAERLKQYDDAAYDGKKVNEHAQDGEHNPSPSNQIQRSE